MLQKCRGESVNDCQRKGISSLTSAGDGSKPPRCYSNEGAAASLRTAHEKLTMPTEERKDTLAIILAQNSSFTKEEQKLNQRERNFMPDSLTEQADSCPQSKRLRQSISTNSGSLELRELGPAGGSAASAWRAVAGGW